MRITLCAVEIAQALKRRNRIGMACSRHASRTDRRADQCAFARRGWQPASEQPLVQLLKNQSLRPACGSGYNCDILRAQTVLSYVRECVWPGVNIQNGHLAEWSFIIAASNLPSQSIGITSMLFSIASLING